MRPESVTTKGRFIPSDGLRRGSSANEPAPKRVVVGKEMVVRLMRKRADRSGPFPAGQEISAARMVPIVIKSGCAHQSCVSLTRVYGSLDVFDAHWDHEPQSSCNFSLSPSHGEGQGESSPHAPTAIPVPLSTRGEGQGRGCTGRPTNSFSPSPPREE